MTIKAKPWSELTSFHTPQWLKDQKYGIYTYILQSWLLHR
jgi:hypothetical protein